MGLPRNQLAADSLNVSVAAGILMHSVLGATGRLTQGGGNTAESSEVNATVQ